MGETSLNKKFELFYENTITWNIPMGVSPMFRKKLLIECRTEWDESLMRLSNYDFLRMIPLDNLFLIYQSPGTITILKNILLNEGYLKVKVIKKLGVVPD